VDHPEIAGYRDVSLPVRLDGERLRAGRMPPAAGEHTVELLEELEFDRASIDQLLASGVVSSTD
jgi:crotonobetainyl-CoA:carnitine CoA-transferase CaiB-like acyl-CoA transferase